MQLFADPFASIKSMSQGLSGLPECMLHDDDPLMPDDLDAELANIDTPGALRRQASKKLSKEMTIETSLRESIWLWDAFHGQNADEIASRRGVGVRRVRYGLARCAGMKQENSAEIFTASPDWFPCSLSGR